VYIEPPNEWALEAVEKMRKVRWSGSSTSMPSIRVPLTIEEIAMLQFAVVHAKELWEPVPGTRALQPKDKVTDKLLEKLEQFRERLEVRE